jgi:hypothetical protein
MALQADTVASVAVVRQSVDELQHQLSTEVKQLREIVALPRITVANVHECATGLMVSGCVLMVVVVVVVVVVCVCVMARSDESLGLLCDPFFCRLKLPTVLRRKST